MKAPGKVTRPTVRVWVQGYTLPGLFSHIELQGKPWVRLKYLGHWAPPVT